MKIITDVILCPVTDLCHGEVFKMKSEYYMIVCPLNPMPTEAIYAVNLENGLLKRVESYEKVEPFLEAALQV